MVKVASWISHRYVKYVVIAFWLAGGRVLAGMNVNVWDVGDQIRALIESGQSIDTDRLADPETPLESLVSP